jgi:hypothetical protein
MASQTEQQSGNLPVSSPLPSLSTELNSLYLSLNDNMRQVFIKMLRFIWGVVNGRHLGFVPLFWAVDLFRLRFSLTSSQFSALTYIYHISNKGKRFVHSDAVYMGLILPEHLNDSKISVLNKLKRKGYITRSTRDPGQPYSQRAQHNKHPVYIALAPAGVKLIEKCERELYNMLLNTCIDDLTDNKKAR